MNRSRINGLLEQEYRDKLEKLRKDNKYTHRIIFKEAFEDFIKEYKNTKKFRFKHIHFEKIKVKTVIFNISNDIVPQINSIAKEYQLPQSRVVREIMIRYLNKKQK